MPPAQEMDEDGLQHHRIPGWNTDLMINKLAEPAQECRQEIPVSTHHLHHQGQARALPAQGETTGSLNSSPTQEDVIKNAWTAWSCSMLVCKHSTIIIPSTGSKEGALLGYLSREPYRHGWHLK